MLLPILKLKNNDILLEASMRLFLALLCYALIFSTSCAEEAITADKEHPSHANTDVLEEEAILDDLLISQEISETIRPAQSDTAPVKEEDYTNSALLQGLNKVTARTSPLPIEKGGTVTFGNLEITLHSCWKSPPEEEPESKALLAVWEQVPGEKKKQAFYGWMFASSPAVSALEHPIYDVTLIRCENKVTSDSPSASIAE